MMVELHPKSCICHGGSWMSPVGQSGSPCTRGGLSPDGSLVVTMDQWRAMGKPHDVEEFEDALAHLSHAVVPRRFERHEVAIAVRLRLGGDEGVPAVDGPIATDNLSRGGARVRSRLAVRKGDVLWFEEATGAFGTRAEIKDVTAAADDGVPRLHLSFLDGLAPAFLLVRTPWHS
jgi:hypothetical protein